MNHKNLETSNCVTAPKNIRKSNEDMAIDVSSKEGRVGGRKTETANSLDMDRRKIFAMNWKKMIF